MSTSNQLWGSFYLETFVNNLTILREYQRKAGKHILRENEREREREIVILSLPIGNVTLASFNFFIFVSMSFEVSSTKVGVNKQASENTGG